MTKPIRILIVEDEFVAAKLLKMSLERGYGYDVCEPIPTGEEAVERIGLESPDVILMDVRLAGKMSGIEAAREIIARYQIPIVFITGYSTLEMIEQFETLSPVPYLEKPAGSSKIAVAIEAALAKNEIVGE